MEIDKDRWQSMKIDTHNFLVDRFSSISDDINRLIFIDYMKRKYISRVLLKIVIMATSQSLLG